MDATAAPPARLKSRYLDEIRPALVDRFGYSSVMQAPKLEKITLNMGVGSAKQDTKSLRAATDQLATIAGQRPSLRRARKSIAAFKLREGMPVGVAVTLRGERGYEFLDRLISIAIPRIRDFRGLNPRSFDGRGNYSLGVKEQIIFPEIDYDSIDEVRGMDITITTSAASDPEAFALLLALGMPFAAQGRPKDFQALDEQPAAGNGGAPAAQETPVEEAPAEEATAEEPQAEEAPAEEAPADAPAAEEAQAEQAPAEEAATDPPAAEQAQAAEEAATEEPAAEQAPDEAAHEQPAAEPAAEPAAGSQEEAPASETQEPAASSEEDNTDKETEG
jgi:large subunit ribosomal protein L5